MTNDLHKRAEDAVTRLKYEAAGAEFSNKYADLCQDASDVITALLARLEAVTQERDNLADVFNSAWDKEQARAEKAEAALAEATASPNKHSYKVGVNVGHAKLPAAYRMGLEAGTQVCERAEAHRASQLSQLGVYDREQVQRWTAGRMQAEMNAENIRALPDKTPAEILAQIEEHGE